MYGLGARLDLVQKQQGFPGDDGSAIKGGQTGSNVLRLEGACKYGHDFPISLEVHLDKMGEGFPQLAYGGGLSYLSCSTKQQGLMPFFVFPF